MIAFKRQISGQRAVCSREQNFLIQFKLVVGGGRRRALDDLRDPRFIFRVLLIDGDTLKSISLFHGRHFGTK